MKAHIFQQTEHQLRYAINGKIDFQLQIIAWNLPMIRTSYKLTKRTIPESIKDIPKRTIS